MLKSPLLLLFFGNAPASATINLIVQILMGITLLIGMVLARQKKFRAHGVCQSTVMLLNLIAIGIYMLPVFNRSVLPKFPAGVTGSLFYALPAWHAIIGVIAELLGLYVILSAGTKLLPQSLRFKNYRLWMRATLALWWVAIALGIATFIVWHLSDSAVPVTPVEAARPAAGAELSSARMTVTMKNFEFEPKELTVAPGTTIVWKNAQGKHTIKAGDSSFESSVVPVNGEFSYRFEKEGRYNFFCTLHGDTGGREMAGTIIVAASAKR